MRRFRALIVGGLVVATVALSGFAQDPLALDGLVTVDARPQAGVTVQVYPVGATTPAATATTGTDGRFHVQVPRGIYRVVFSGAGLDPFTRNGVVVIPDVASEVRVQMRRTAAAATSGGAPLPLRAEEVPVRIETPLGAIVIAVDTARAPTTAGNFLRYVDGGFYDGGRFHRATRPDNYTPAPPNRPMMEVVQGGINPERRAGAFPPIPLERTTATGLKHVAGTVSMARGAAADSATSDFFILLDDQPSLDAGGLRFDDGQGAAAFGRVISGMDVVRRIQQQPVSGQNLVPPVPIVRMTRVK